MAQTGTWSSSLLKGLGASSVAVPATNPSSRIKQFAVALSLSTVAAMASFAPDVSHAAEGQAASPIELSQSVVTPVDTDLQASEIGGMDSDIFDKNFTEAQRKADNPFTQKQKIPDRDRDLIDTMSDKINAASKTVEDNMEQGMKSPLFDNPVYKIYDAVTSPLDALVKMTTDKGSIANDRAQKAANITNVAIKYATVGAGALVTDGVSVVKDGITTISEHRDKEHAHIQSVMDSVRERQAKIYDHERERMAAEHGSAFAPNVASRVDVEKASSGGLDTSNDGLDIIFKAEPVKASKYDHDNGLSR